MQLCGHIYDFDLMQILLDIRDKAISNGDKRRIGKVLSELNKTNEFNDNLSHDKDKFKIVRKLIPTK